jgi:hypothetical protein
VTTKLFGRLNFHYSKVHSLVNHSKPVSKEQLQTCKESIRLYMKYYRDYFPKETVTPKQHMIKQHVIPSLAKWGVGLALFREHGVEQSHSMIDALKGRARGIRNPKDRIRILMEQHFLSVATHYRIAVGKK